MKISSLIGRDRTDGADRIATEGKDTEHKQHDTTYNLEQHLMLGQEFVHETHAVTGNQRIDDITQASPQPRNKAIPTAFVERTLYTKHAHRT